MITKIQFENRRCLQNCRGNPKTLALLKILYTYSINNYVNKVICFRATSYRLGIYLQEVLATIAWSVAPGDMLMGFCHVSFA